MDAKVQKSKSGDQWQNGDIIFHSSDSRQCQAIELATDSKFSHVGMIVFHRGQWMVAEAVQPVRFTPVKDFIRRGDGDYVVSRLKNQADRISDDDAKKLLEEAKKYEGKDYDIKFMWGDNELYCSELVWLLYERVLGIELCDLRPLNDYQLGHPVVRQQLEARYGVNLPLDEKMVSPEDIYRSSLLVTVEKVGFH